MPPPNDDQNEGTSRAVFLNRVALERRRRASGGGSSVLLLGLARRVFGFPSN